MNSSNPQSPSTLPALAVELASAPARTDDDLLIQFAFGGMAPDAQAHAGLRPLAGGPIYEIWRSPGAIHSGEHANIHWRASNHLLAGSMAMPMLDDGKEVTRSIYQQLFDCAAACGYPALLRIWNFMPGINQGEGDSECYKRFCAGRALVFDAHPGARGQVPAATAIGRRGGDAGNDLEVHFLAARLPGQRLENPRQVSAPDYPRRYGPRSPQFARATVWPGEAGMGQRILLVSGTASIVGHESLHIGDLGRQLEETWTNLEQLRRDGGADQAIALRVYIRNEQDYPAVREFIRKRTPAGCAVLYLHADICRAELLLEIEAVYRIPAPAL